MSESPTAAKTTLTPYLTCRNAAEAVEFYKKAFGAEANGVMKGPDGRIMHACISIRGIDVYLADEFIEYGAHGPQTLGGSSVTLHFNVPDCDAFYQRAIDAGCTVRMPMEDMFWGDRYGVVTDPFGHEWAVATTIRRPSKEEIEKSIAEMAPSAA